MSIFSNFIKDSFWTIGAQGVSLLTSIIVSFILPKYISVEQFGYWQYFLLWASYVGVMHLGYGDGVYLKLGGQYWESIDRKEWIPQIQSMFFVQLIISLMVVLFSFLLCKSEKYLIIFLWTAAYLVIENTYKIITMAMMATDQIPFVSKTVIIDKLIMSVLVLYLIFIHNENASNIMCSYTLAHLVVCIMAIHRCRLFASIQIPDKKIVRKYSHGLQDWIHTHVGKFRLNINYGSMQVSCRTLLEYRSFFKTLIFNNYSIFPFIFYITDRICPFPNSKKNKKRGTSHTI